MKNSHTPLSKEKTDTIKMQKEKNQKKLENIRVIAFDYDGTLVDSLDLCWNMIGQIAKKHNLPVLNKKENYLKLFEKNVFDGLKELDIPIIKLFPLFFEMVAEQHKAKNHPKFFTGVPEVLKKLKELYHVVIITSNSNGVVEEILKEKNLSNYFDMILGAESSLHKEKKIEKVKKEFNADANEIVLIADTLGDINEAKNAGTKTIGVTCGFHTEETLQKGNPDFLIDDPKELLEILL